MVLILGLSVNTEGELLITLLEAGATQVMVDALIESMELAGFGSTRCKYWHGGGFSRVVAEGC